MSARPDRVSRPLRLPLAVMFERLVGFVLVVARNDFDSHADFRSFEILATAIRAANKPSLRPGQNRHIRRTGPVNTPSLTLMSCARCGAAAIDGEYRGAINKILGH